MLPKMRLPETVRSLVTVWEPVTVRSPPVIPTLPEELMVILSTAAPSVPVENISDVLLDSLVKEDSDLAVIAAATSRDFKSLSSSGAENSILPNTALVSIDVAVDWILITEPNSDFAVIPLVSVLPVTSKSVVLILPVPVILLNPVILLERSTDRALPPMIVPGAAPVPVNKLISSPEADIILSPKTNPTVVNVPSIPTSLNPDIFFWVFTTTALSIDTEPLDTPPILLISAAEAETFTPSIWSSLVSNFPSTVTLFNPPIFIYSSTTRALDSLATPGITESKYPNSLLDKLFPPKVREPTILTLPENSAPIASKWPILRLE